MLSMGFAVCIEEQSKTITKSPTEGSVWSYAKQEQVHPGPVGQWGSKERNGCFSLPNRQSEEPSAQSLLYLITQGPTKSITTLSPYQSVLAFDYREYTCSSMDSQLLVFTQTMTLTSTLGYLTLCSPPRFKKKEASQVLCTWEAQASLPGCFQTFLLNQRPSSAFLSTSKQSVSFSCV